MKAIRKILAVVVGIITAVFAFLSVNVLPIALHKGLEFLMIIYIILCVAVPFAVFYLTARIIMWRPLGILDGFRRLPRWFLSAIAVAYIFTWAFGVPAVQTSTNSKSVDLYKQYKAHGRQDIWDAHPWFRTSAAFPLLPGLIVSYHEYQVAGLHGWGGWEINIWYITGVKSIGGLTIWIS